MPIDNGGREKAIWSEIRRLSESNIELHSRVEDLEEHDKDHEQRLRASEERRFPMQQVATIIAILSLVVAVVAVWADTH
jgi:hypothetical protein